VSDEELVLALRRRDRDVGELLYDRLIRVIEWTVLRVLGARSAEHDDLVQSAFEQVVKTVYSGAYRQTCSLTSWASSIACNLALNAVRTRKRDRLSTPVDDELVATAAGDPEALLHARRQLHRLRNELAAMNPERAQAVVLHDVNGLDLRELAAVQGVSLAAAQSRLSRGRRELAGRMPDLEWGAP
jgi:RNA polymerase sigma-70 factor (ECF subfamily)